MKKIRGPGGAIHIWYKYLFLLNIAKKIVSHLFYFVKLCFIFLCFLKYSRYKCNAHLYRLFLSLRKKQSITNTKEPTYMRIEMIFLCVGFLYQSSKNYNGSSCICLNRSTLMFLTYKLQPTYWRTDCLNQFSATTVVYNYYGWLFISLLKTTLPIRKCQYNIWYEMIFFYINL